MDILDAIRNRHSCRTYDGAAPDTETLCLLDRAADRAVKFASRVTGAMTDTNGAPIATIEPRLYVEDDPRLNGATGTYGFIKGARIFTTLFCGNTPADRVAGALALEHMMITATALGFDMCWLGGTFSRKLFKAISDEIDGMSIVAVSPVGHRAPSPRLFERMARAMVGATKRKPADELFTGITAADSAEISLILEAVRFAPSSGNSQPWRATVSDHNRHVELYSVLSNRFSDLDMGIALCHFIMASEAYGIDWHVAMNDDSGRVSFSLSRR